ncbi:MULTISPECIES: hypothetical protein [Protofrankia]|uniref:Uncharacterized protein n=1 Tax=Protofrankia coriariae TaxID=1562887 RepID=A0ABR5F6N2_9ACTN|nr:MULTISPECIES: hypothetical protein [Protofrankia]KLL12392.1 hypothetical protein FrCorBMG51_05155 [Protofrankia coriariae]ONH37283.1 hypothetical protein BL254_04340 [Protofrankia sp. BMG5.30]
MTVLSGVLVLLSAALLGAGVLGSTGFVYASIVIGLLAAALLPLGARRPSRRPPAGRDTH